VTEIRTVDAIVVGAGLAGLYALFKLQEAGLSVAGFEAAHDVGGVWYWNRYPGARCDVQSMEYSYSFSDDLQQEWVWTERFAAQPEILAYINNVADRFDLRRYISFSTRVTLMEFIEADAHWLLTTDRGEQLRARFCVMASGSLSAARLPDVPGIGSFAGEIYHSGQWPHHDIDLDGKRVAVIGTGSSGIQAIPQIAARAEHLLVLQRTPNFVIPARNHLLSADDQAMWKGDYPAVRAKAKQVGTLYEFSELKAFDVDAEARQAEYKRRWEGGGVNFMHAFKDIMTDDAANATAADFVRSRIREVVADPDVAERLCPKDYPIGAKRICVGTDYYETYNRPNVALVDLREMPDLKIGPQSIETGTAQYPVDIIVCATGYDALTGALARIAIKGRAGQLLADKWTDGPRNYLGLMAADFPNLFIVTGPGSPSVLVNMVVGIEQHVDWITNCIVHLRDQGATTIEPDPKAEQQWVERVNVEADKTLFVKANSWYLGANIPGKPRVFLPFVGGIGRYREICDDVAAKGYAGFVIVKA